MANQNLITTFFTCRRCQEDKPSNESMEKWARLNVGLASEGLQVWCVRHRQEVVHVTPETLRMFLDNRPECQCCPGGRHVAGPERVS